MREVDVLRTKKKERILTVIDPVHSLSFSMQSNPGVYAVLLGSGVSRSAKIPTGWEITLDLVRKLSTLQGQYCGPDPEKWYLGKFDNNPNYSNILNEIAKTATERQQLLRPYWEPTDEERQEGSKQPTKAHRSLAALVRRGFVRVIITTNFDRLMELALRDEGVEPIVLSTVDQVDGALPLIHTQCCLFKVHGDYLDPNIRNTHDELDNYPEAMDGLLDRIFDEFGLIVCGWSAEWDGALRRAIERTQSRRFTTYWTSMGDPGDAAQRLIEHRKAQLVVIDGADAFFEALRAQVEAIDKFSHPHPLSTEAAVNSLKRYMSEHRYRIQLMDLVEAEVRRVTEMLTGSEFAAHSVERPDSQSVTARIRSYEATCSTLVAMANVGGFWAEPEHHAVWRRALASIFPRGPKEGNVLWLDLQKYPATLLLYALGLGAVEGGRLDLLADLFDTVVERNYNGDGIAVLELSPAGMFEHGQKQMQMLEGMERHFVPLNDWLFSLFGSIARRTVTDEERYVVNFDRFEILVALSAGSKREGPWGNYWAPPGCFGYRYQNRERILSEIRQSLQDGSNESPYVKSGIFGSTREQCETEIGKLVSFLSELNWH